VLDSGEAAHPPRDVAPGEVRDGEDDQHHDRSDDAGGAGAPRELSGIGGAQADRARDRGQQDGEAQGDDPPEEGRAEAESAALLGL
jgi:hypothetical protein